ncbi:hypothetical Protein psc1_02570 [Candidatus Phytoplasma solani]
MKNKKLKYQVKLLQNFMQIVYKNDKKAIFNLVKEFKNELNLTTILKTIQIKRSTYYYWLKTKDKLKEKEEKNLLQQKRINALCINNQYFYGHRKITDLYQKPLTNSSPRKKFILL